eukprot:6914111-Prymnesium_polylepis.1
MKCECAYEGHLPSKPGGLFWFCLRESNSGAARLRYDPNCDRGLCVDLLSLRDREGNPTRSERRNEGRKAGGEGRKEGEILHT